MPSAFQPSDDALARYIRGECQAAEQRLIAAWLTADEANASALAAVEALLGNADHRPHDIERMWGRLRADALATHPSRARRIRVLDATPSTRRKSFLPVLSFAIAAALVALLYGGSTSHLEKPTPPQTIREHVTRAGERIALDLADNSHVIIGPMSRLRIPDSFSSTSRSIELEGEAIFEVKHDPKALFRVHTARADFVDLGTRFDVRAYTREVPAVAVAEGEVLVTGDTSSASPHQLHVRAGKVAVVHADGTIALDSRATVRAQFAWNTGRLQFENAEMRSVIATLARWYDLDIAVASDSLAQRRISADVNVRDADAMLQSIAAALGARVTRNGRRVSFVSAP